MAGRRSVPVRARMGAVSDSGGGSFRGPGRGMVGGRERLYLVPTAGVGHRSAVGGRGNDRRAPVVEQESAARIAGGRAGRADRSPDSAATRRVE